MFGQGFRPQSMEQQTWKFGSQPPRISVLDLAPEFSGIPGKSARSEGHDWLTFWLTFSPEITFFVLAISS